MRTSNAHPPPPRSPRPQVKVQTVPGFAKGLADGLPKFVAAEGVGGLFKGLTPLWGRQIPYTMMKFGAFENVVQALYKYVVPKPKSECSKTEQIAVSFAAGYIAGVFCAIVSHPADNLVSKLNSTKVRRRRPSGLLGFARAFRVCWVAVCGVWVSKPNSRCPRTGCAPWVRRAHGGVR